MIHSAYDLQFAGDGYSVIHDMPFTTTVSVYITGDDTTTWVIEGSIDKSNWYKILDINGNESRSTNTIPTLFDVSQYKHLRVWVSNTSLAYRCSIKYMQGMFI